VICLSVGITFIDAFRNEQMGIIKANTVYFCGRLDFIRIFHLHKLQFIRRISASDSYPVMKECVNYYMLSHKFSDELSMYALDGTKTSFSIIRNAVYDMFADVCCSDM